MNSKQVINKEACMAKYCFGMFESYKEKNYWNGIILKELFKKYTLNYNAQNVIDEIDALMPDNLFKTSREGVINAQLLVMKLLRFQDYMNNSVLTSNSQFKTGGVVSVIHNINVPYSFIVKDGDQVDIYSVKDKKNKDLKTGGRSIYTKVADSMELYLLQLAGEKLYPNAYVTPNIVFLTHPEDKHGNLVPKEFFNNKKDSNIIKYHFPTPSKKKMDDRIEDVINGTVQTCNKKCNTCTYDRICNYVHEDADIEEIQVKAKTTGSVTFNKEQQRVINVKTGVYRVLAGAGSGKTTCVANRIVELVKDGTNLNEILMVTYTTKGVQEMKEKIEYWLGMNNVNFNPADLNIFTFNSFGHELIKKEYKALGFTAEPELFEKSENLDLIKQLLDSHDEIARYNYVNPFMDFGYAKGAVYQAFEDFTILKNEEVVFPEDVEEVLNVSPTIASEILALFVEYKKYMKDNNLIDYDDQIQMCYKILSNEENVKKYGFEHIICDEFQDSNTIQIHILKLLASYKYNRSVMVVGDDSQAIFGWRGATSDNILNFHKFFKNTVDVELVRNYRSTKEIVNFANKINDINKSKLDKTLKSENDGEEPQFIAGNISKLVSTVIDDIKKKNLEYQDVAVIARTKAALLKAREEFIKAGIPVYLSISELLVDNGAVKHIVDFVRFTNDTTLDLDFVKYLQVSDYNNFEKFKNGAFFYKYVEDEKEKFLDEFESHSEDKEKLEFVISKLEKIGETNIAIRTLVEIVKEKNFDNLGELNNFLQNMMLYKSDHMIERLEGNFNAITLTTAHSSKGREWDNVYVDLNAFKYPTMYNYHQDKNAPSVEEERRLLFVAATRAKKDLTLVSEYSSLAEEVCDALGLSYMKC